jgi:hypothetical protein
MTKKQPLSNRDALALAAQVRRVIESTPMGLEVDPHRGHVTPAAVKKALPRVSVGLKKYMALQARLRGTNVATDRDFQRAFNGFYRVRRNAAWQKVFYGLLEREKRKPRGFEFVLRELYEQLDRVEASFASKLAATVNTALPVLDSIVLKNLGLKLPLTSSADRLGEIVKLHEKVRDHFEVTLFTHDGARAVEAFDEAYPNSGLHNVKKLDLLLWQSR